MESLPCPHCESDIRHHIRHCDPDGYPHPLPNQTYMEFDNAKVAEAFTQDYPWCKFKAKEGDGKTHLYWVGMQAS